MTSLIVTTVEGMGLEVTTWSWRFTDADCSWDRISSVSVWWIGGTSCRHQWSRHLSTCSTCVWTIECWMWTLKLEILSTTLKVQLLQLLVYYTLASLNFGVITNYKLFVGYSKTYPIISWIYQRHMQSREQCKLNDATAVLFHPSLGGVKDLSSRLSTCEFHSQLNSTR